MWALVSMVILCATIIRAGQPRCSEWGDGEIGCDTYCRYKFKGFINDAGVIQKKKFPLDLQDYSVICDKKMDKKMPPCVRLEGIAACIKDQVAQTYQNNSNRCANKTNIIINPDTEKLITDDKACYIRCMWIIQTKRMSEKNVVNRAQLYMILPKWLVDDIVDTCYEDVQVTDACLYAIRVMGCVDRNVKNVQ